MLKRLITTITLFVIKYAPVLTPYCFQNVFIKPFYDNTNVTINFTFKSQNPTGIYIICELYYLDDNQTINLYSKSDISQTIFNDYFYLNTAFIEKNNTLLRFRARKNDAYLCNSEFTLIKKSSDFITISRGIAFQQSLAGQYLDDQGNVHSFSERINFYNPKRVIYGNTLYLDLNIMNINYICDYNEEYIKDAQITLVIYDLNNDFALIPYEDKNLYTKSFELELYKSDSYYSLSLKDNLYLNRSLHLISKENKQGFIKVNQIYLPKNLKTKSYKMALFFKDFGYQGLNVKFNCIYNFTYNFVGACNNSFYCINQKDSNYQPVESSKIEVML